MDNLDECLKRMFTNGKIAERDNDDLGFSVDKDAQGSE